MSLGPELTHQRRSTITENVEVTPPDFVRGSGPTLGRTVPTVRGKELRKAGLRGMREGDLEA